MRAQEKRNKPPNKAQKRNIMSTYLKNMAGYKQNELKNKSFKDIQNETRVEGSSKRAGEELEQESSKKQKLEEDKETAELQRLIEVVPDKEADRSSKMYLVFSHMLKSFDREDLETLWKLVKAKHGSTRPEEGYEIVLWGDLKTMFDLHVEDQGRIVEIKRLHDDLEVTASKVCVIAAKFHQNPLHESHYLNTHLSETINLQTQQRDAQRKGLRSIGQALKNMMGGKRK
ncbi:hypothetical protein Tco_0349017 [Tanacetum coccineum]